MDSSGCALFAPVSRDSRFDAWADPRAHLVLLFLRWDTPCFCRFDGRSKYFDYEFPYPSQLEGAWPGVSLRKGCQSLTWFVPCILPRLSAAITLPSPMISKENYAVVLLNWLAPRFTCAFLWNFRCFHV